MVSFIMSKTSLILNYLPDEIQKQLMIAMKVLEWNYQARGVNLINQNDPDNPYKDHKVCWIC